jgi:hypothetical protein
MRSAEIADALAADLDEVGPGDLVQGGEGALGFGEQLAVRFRLKLQQGDASRRFTAMLSRSLTDTTDTPKKSEAAFVAGSSSELSLDHELHDSSGSRRTLEISIRAAWR